MVEDSHSISKFELLTSIDNLGKIINQIEEKCSSNATHYSEPSQSKKSNILDAININASKESGEDLIENFNVENTVDVRKITQSLQTKLKQQLINENSLMSIIQTLESENLSLKMENKRLVSIQKAVDEQNYELNPQISLPIFLQNASLKTNCMDDTCKRPFGFFRWRQHCGLCGCVFCSDCAPTVDFVKIRLTIRICKNCYSDNKTMITKMVS